MMYVLHWWAADESLAGSLELPGVTPAMVKRWFELGPEDCPCYAYEVEVAHAGVILTHFGGEFDFDRYTYTLEGQQSFPGERVDADGNAAPDGAFYPRRKGGSLNLRLSDEEAKFLRDYLDMVEYVHTGPQAAVDSLKLLAERLQPPQKAGPAMSERLRESLAAHGWAVERDEPLELRHKDGSLATGEAAEMVIGWLFGATTPSNLYS